MDRIIFGIFLLHYIPEFAAIFFFSRGCREEFSAFYVLVLFAIALIVTMFVTKRVDYGGLFYAGIFMIPCILGILL